MQRTLIFTIKLCSALFVGTCIYALC